MIKNIGKTCNITTGKLDANKAVNDGAYPFFTCAEFPDKIDTFAFDDDVVLVAGNNANGNFHVSRFKGKFNAYQRTYVLTAKNGEDINYIYYTLKLELKRLRERSQGTQTKFLTMPILTNIVVNDIKYDDQVAISSILSRIDKKIELNNKINKELEATAKLIYDYWFVQFDFPDKNGKPYKSSGGKMVYNQNLKREIPEGWVSGSLRDFEPKIITGKTPSTKDKNNFGGEIPFICIGDVRGNMYITKTEITLSEVGAASQNNKFIPKDAICVTCIASPGLIAFATSESQTNQQLNSVICSKKENQYFLYFYLKDYFNFARAKMGNTFANMNKDDFSSILLPYPKNEIVDSFSEKVKFIFDLILQNSKENDLLTKKRDWLLPMLMNGQVTVNKEN
tara:strand:+ start:1136 stop:2317 length:1182 start_codon:yes stop_codon:yes gene_type:complete